MQTAKLSGSRHTQCPAYRYCRAVEAHGVMLADDSACYLEERDGVWHPAVQPQDEDSRGTATSGPACDQPGPTSGEQARILVAELLDQAALARTRFDQHAQDNQQAQQLQAAFDTVFSARLALWQAMARATLDGREFTDVELGFYERRITEAQQALDLVLSTAPPPLALRALTAHDRALKERYTLQFDAQMVADINSIIGNIANSRPTLIVGDKGIAKTQVAKFVMSLYGAEPLIVSVKGDMMSDEVIGKVKHDREQGTFVFEEGMLLTAMRKGLPLLLDEINFGDQAIIARFQDILLRRPGEVVFVQESGEEPVTVQPGFAVLATANEASERYRHREILDPAIRDRFNIVMRSYPDLSSDPLMDIPPRLMRLVLSSAVDRWGIASPHLNLRLLELFVRLAHATEYLYSVPARDVTLDLNADELTSIVVEEAQPLMTDCITPRTISKLIDDCARGNLPGMRLDAALIQHSIDALDQAGALHNSTLANQMRILYDIGTPERFEGQDFIDLDGLTLDEIDALTTQLPQGADAPQADAVPSTSQEAFPGLSLRAVKAVLSDLAKPA